jgi:hypothetical protein
MEMPIVNEWVHAELRDETPVTAELRRMFNQLRDDYGKRSDAELDYRTSALADAVYALELRIAALERENR